MVVGGLGVRFTGVALALLAAVLLAACGSSDGTPTAAEAETSTTAAIPDTPNELVQPAPGEAPFEQLADTGEVPIDGAPDPNLSVAELAEQLPLPDAVSDDAAFKEALDIFLAASYKYFGESVELAGGNYHLPDELIAYDGAAGDEGPDCGGSPAGLQNAAYCRDIEDEGSNGIVTWDETSLLEPLYTELGDGAIAFVVGHEFAHQAQDRLGLIQNFPLTVEKELNADCLTGALWGDFGRAGAAYTPADIRTFFSGISVVGDAPGTPWQNIHAHGNVQERSNAFLFGFENGFSPCIEEYGPGFSGGKRPG